MKTDEYEKMYRFEEECWWYKSRRELIMDTVAGIKHLNECKTLKILDVGCGTGLNLKFLERFGEVSGVDMSKDALGFSKSRKNVSLIRSHAEDLPFKHSSFDVVCALDLLEHIKDDVDAVKEFYRVLKSGGYLVLTVPAFMFLWSGHDVAAYHIRRYTKALLIKKLRLCRFSIERCTYWNFILFPAVALIRLINKGNRWTSGSDLRELPDLLNSVLLNSLRLENAAIRREINLPVGVSILCICRKG